jgi:hypothetical protein
VFASSQGGFQCNPRRSDTGNPLQQGPIAWVTFVHCHGTFGSLTFRIIGVNLAQVDRSPLWLGSSKLPFWGWLYEVAKRLLRGIGVRGGPLVIQAGTRAGGRSDQSNACLGVAVVSDFRNAAPRFNTRRPHTMPKS